jgi:hypothetical protein
MLDLNRLGAELFEAMPCDRLSAVEWITARVGRAERRMRELVAWAPFETDPDRLQCCELEHTLLEWSRAKLLVRQNELLRLDG